MNPGAVDPDGPFVFHRCSAVTTLPQALAQSLQCPLLDPARRPLRLAAAHTVAAAPRPPPAPYTVSPRNTGPDSHPAELQHADDAGDGTLTTLGSLLGDDSPLTDSLTAAGPAAASGSAGAAIKGGGRQASASDATALASSAAAAAGVARWAYDGAAGADEEVQLYTSFMAAGKRRVAKRPPAKHEHRRCALTPSFHAPALTSADLELRPSLQRPCAPTLRSRTQFLGP